MLATFFSPCTAGGFQVVGYQRMLRLSLSLLAGRYPLQVSRRLSWPPVLSRVRAELGVGTSMDGWFGFLKEKVILLNLPRNKDGPR
jgi:hypothetical protein